MLPGRCPQLGDFDSYPSSGLLAFGCDHSNCVKRNKDDICRKFGLCKAATITMSGPLGTNAGLPLDAVIWLPLLRLITNKNTGGVRDIMRNYILPVLLSHRQREAEHDHLIEIVTACITFSIDHCTRVGLES